MTHITLRTPPGSRILADYSAPSRAQSWEPYLTLALREADTLARAGTACTLWIDYAPVTLYHPIERHTP